MVMTKTFDHLPAPFLVFFIFLPVPGWAFLLSHVDVFKRLGNDVKGNSITTGRNVDDVERIGIALKRKSIESRIYQINIKQIQLKVKRIKIEVKRNEIAVERKIPYAKRIPFDAMRKISYAMKKISSTKRLAFDAMCKISYVKRYVYDNFQKFFAAQRLVFEAYNSPVYFKSNRFALNLVYSDMQQLKNDEQR